MVKENREGGGFVAGVLELPPCGFCFFGMEAVTGVPIIGTPWFIPKAAGEGGGC